MLDLASARVEVHIDAGSKNSVAALESFRHDDRRVLGRITPKAVLVGRFGHTAVRILDVSLRGVRVAHREPLPVGGASLLTFQWDDKLIEIWCEVVRSRLHGFARTSAEFHTGLRVMESAKGSSQLLRQLVCWHVTRALEEQIADAHGIPPTLEAEAEAEGEPVESLYIRCELVRGAWRQITTAEPYQPSLGFTVCANESPQNISRLCQTYLLSNSDTRQLIQKMAAASITAGPCVRRSYQP